MLDPFRQEWKTRYQKGCLFANGGFMLETTTLPKTNIAPEKSVFPKGNWSSNHQFSGTMLVSGRVLVLCEYHSKPQFESASALSYHTPAAECNPIWQKVARCPIHHSEAPIKNLWVKRSHPCWAQQQQQQQQQRGPFFGAVCKIPNLTSFQVGSPIDWREGVAMVWSGLRGLHLWW